MKALVSTTLSCESALPGARRRTVWNLLRGGAGAEAAAAGLRRGSGGPVGAARHAAGAPRFLGAWGREAGGGRAPRQRGVLLAAADRLLEKLDELAREGTEIDEDGLLDLCTGNKRQKEGECELACARERVDYEGEAIQRRCSP